MYLRDRQYGRRKAAFSHRGLSLLHLSRSQLEEEQLMPEHISRIYRSLFVHSACFGDVISVSNTSRWPPFRRG